MSGVFNAIASIFGGGSQPSGGGGDGGAAAAAERQAAEEARKKGLRESLAAMFDPSAHPELGQEEADLAKATTDYYTGDRQAAYDKAAREQKFALVRGGHVNDSVASDAENLLNQNDQKASTRIADASTSAVNNLRAERQRAMDAGYAAISSGSGPEAVDAAHQASMLALNNAKSAGRENLFSDLFSNTALGINAANANTANNGLLTQYLKPKSGFSPAGSTQNGGGTSVNA